MISGVTADVQAALDVLDAVRETARKTPGLTKTVFRRRVRSVKSRMLPELRIKPGPPRYPLRWKSAKQRRFVMAKLRREGNLPYQRTDDYINSFDVVGIETAEGGILRMVNTHPAARYIGGDDQQPFHIDTGWQSYAEVVVKYSEIATNEFIDDWFTIADPFAGIPR